MAGDTNITLRTSNDDMKRSGMGIHMVRRAKEPRIALLFLQCTSFIGLNGSSQSVSILQRGKCRVRYH